jgi:hypothetical protein
MKHELFYLIITTVASLATSVSAVLIYVQIKNNNEWNRRKSTFDILDKSTTGLFSILFAKIKNLNTRYTKNEIQDRNHNYLNLYDLVSENEKIELISDIKQLLNIIENICISMKNDIIDEDITYNMLYTFFIDFYYWTKPYISDRRKIESNDAIFSEYEFYAINWEIRLSLDKKGLVDKKRNIIRPKNKLK